MGLNNNRRRNVSVAKKEESVGEKGLQKLFVEIAKFRKEHQKYLIPNLNVQAPASRNYGIIQLNNTTPFKAEN